MKIILKKILFTIHKTSMKEKAKKIKQQNNDHYKIIRRLQDRLA